MDTPTLHPMSMILDIALDDDDDDDEDDESHGHLKDDMLDGDDDDVDGL